jgi:hypothetical protein
LAKKSDVEEIIEGHVDVFTNLICSYKIQRTGRLLRENGVEMVLKFQLFFKFVRICQWKATPGD